MFAIGKELCATKNGLNRLYFVVHQTPFATAVPDYYHKSNETKSRVDNRIKEMSFSDFYTFFLIHYFEGKERYWSDFQFTASSMCFISRGTNNISMLKDQKSWRPVDQYSIPCTYTPKLIIVSKRDGVTEINFLKSEILVCRRIRYSCNGCKKTFTSPLKGAMAGRSLTHFQDRKELLLGLRRFF